MNRKLLPALVLAAVLGGVVYVLANRNGPANSAQLVLQGNIDIRQVELAFNASGRISELLVREGDRVEAGQVLGRLDTARLRLALDQAEAQAGAQRQVLARYRAGSRPEEIRQARAQRDAARTAVADAEQFHRRQADLAARRFISQQQADSARFALDKAHAQLKAAEEALRLTELGPRAEDTAAAAATLAAQEAAAAGLRHDIAEGELRAPRGGIVESRILEPGDMASPQKPAYTLALADPVWARVYLPESALGRVPMGARASLATDGRPGRQYAGWVGHVSPTAQFTPKTVETAELRTSLVYQARVFVCDGGGDLRQGMPVTVTIAYDQAARQGAACGPEK